MRTRLNLICSSLNLDHSRIERLRASLSAVFSRLEEVSSRLRLVCARLNLMRTRHLALRAGLLEVCAGLLDLRSRLLPEFTGRNVKEIAWITERVCRGTSFARRNSDWIALVMLWNRFLEIRSGRITVCGAMGS